MDASGRQLSSPIECSDSRLDEALTYALSNPGKQLRSRLCRVTSAVIAGSEQPSAVTWYRENSADAKHSQSGVAHD